MIKIKFGRSTIPFVLLLALSLLSFSPHACQAKYDYLIETANKIYEIQSRSMTLDEKQAAEIFARACNTLDRLLKDEEFRKDLARLDEPSSKRRPAETVAAAKNDLRQFLNSFLTKEAQVLRQGGVSSDLADNILISAAYFHTDLNTERSSANVISQIERLREHVCYVARSMDRILVDSNVEYLIWDLGQCLAGAAAIGLNVAFAADFPIVAPISINLGVTMIGNGLNNFARDIVEKK